MKHFYLILSAFLIGMLVLPCMSSSQGAMAGFGRKDKTSSVTGAGLKVFFYVRGCDPNDPNNSKDLKGNTLYHDILYIDVRNVAGSHSSTIDIEFVENKGGFKDIDGIAYEATLDLDISDNVGLPIPDAIYFEDLDNTKASEIHFYRYPDEAINIVVNYINVNREEIYQLCNSGQTCLKDNTLSVRTILAENCSGLFNLKSQIGNVLLGFYNKLVITNRDSKGGFPETCIALSEVRSGLRNDELQLLGDKELKTDSLVFEYYRRGGEVTDFTIDDVRFIIPNTTEFCSQNTPCVKAQLDLPYVTQDSFQSSQTIISSAQLPPSMKLYLQAKTAVELNEGFQVNTSNRLKVIMEDCTPPSTGN